MQWWMSNTRASARPAPRRRAARSRARRPWRQSPREVGDDRERSSRGGHVVGVAVAPRPAPAPRSASCCGPVELAPRPRPGSRAGRRAGPARPGRSASRLGRLEMRSACSGRVVLHQPGARASCGASARDRVARVGRLDRELERRRRRRRRRRSRRAGRRPAPTARPSARARSSACRAPPRTAAAPPGPARARARLQQLAQLLVLAQRLAAPAGERIAGASAGRGLLAQRLGRDQQAHRPRRASAISPRLSSSPASSSRSARNSRLQLVPRADRPLLVAVVGQQAVPIEARSPAQYASASPLAARRGGERPERVDVDPETLGRQGEQLADRLDQLPAVLGVRSDRRAWWSALRRFAAAAAGASSGQSASITCSRWSRCPGAKASSFTSAAGLR